MAISKKKGKILPKSSKTLGDFKNILPNVMIFGNFPKRSLDHILGILFFSKMTKFH